MKRTKGLLVITAVFMMLCHITAMADQSTEVRAYPGFQGNGPNMGGPISGWYSFDCWEDDEEDEDDGGPSFSFEPGWYYTPAGWWYYHADGTWPANKWEFIDFRWYRFNEAGHMVTGWFTDGDGLKYYLNPVDDGTLGSMRIGWQLVDGKAYYFNASTNGKLGQLLTNTNTPDGYAVGADGAWVK